MKLCHVIGIWLIFNASPKFRGLSSKIMRAKTSKIWGVLRNFLRCQLLMSTCPGFVVPGFDGPVFVGPGNDGPGFVGSPARGGYLKFAVSASKSYGVYVKLSYGIVS